MQNIYKKIIDTVPLFFFVWDLDKKKTIFISEKFYDFRAQQYFSPDRPKSELRQYIHKDSKTAYDRFFEKLGETNGYHDSIILKTASNLLNIDKVELRTYPMSQNSHHPSYLVGHMVDASRDDDFNHLLEKQLESLDAVTFMLAHELSGPVANIMGLAEMLKIERDGQSPAEHEFAINQIYNFGGEILTLARGLVSLLELQLSQRQLIKKPVVLRQLLSGLVDNFYLKSDEPKIIYDWQHYPEKAEVAADAEKLSKAVEELLVMMLKHTQENEKIVLSVEELQHQNVVCIFIIAETTRLPEEDIRLILEEERKLRVNDVKGRQLSGKLELITAKEIMELHHGTLELYARGPLRGFRLSLPLQTS